MAEQIAEGAAATDPGLRVRTGRTGYTGLTGRAGLTGRIRTGVPVPGIRGPGIRIPGVLAPLGHISAHVVQAETVGGLEPHGMRHQAAVAGMPGHVVRILPAAELFQPAPSPAGILPLRFFRQAQAGGWVAAFGRNGSR